MASYSSSRASSSDTSRHSSSPLSPLSPGSLPEWLIPGRRRTRIFTNAQIRLTFVAIVCVSLGWIITSALAPSNDIILDETELAYSSDSSGVLNEPSGFGLPHQEKLQPGILGDIDVEAGPNGKDKVETGKPGSGVDRPTVKGALSDLKNAMSDRLEDWRPYWGKTTSSFGNDDLIKNQTSEDFKSGRTGDLPVNGTGEVSYGEFVKDGSDDYERLGSRVRIGKCTILFNAGSSSSYWERAIKSHELHDKIQGYRLHVLRQNLLDDVWSKPAYILSLLLREMAKPASERLEWLFWVDGDTIILNPYVPLEAFLPPHDFDEVHLLYSNDWNGLNNGVFPVRVSQWSVEFFAAITAYRHYNPDENLVFRDQSAMSEIMLKPSSKPHVLEAPQRWFNAYQGEHNETLAPFQIRRGDLLVHFAGVIDREPRMTYWLDRAEQHLEDWEVPFKSTSYPAEIKDFWSTQRTMRNEQREKMSSVEKKANDLIASTESSMNDYADRLTEDQKTKINEQMEKLRSILRDDKKKTVDAIEEGMRELEEAKSPVSEVISTAMKTLLRSAHEAIFAGEKDLVEAGSDSEQRFGELKAVRENASKLKEMIMEPQEKWNKASITDAINSLTEARGKWREKLEETALKISKLNEFKENQAQSSSSEAPAGWPSATAAMAMSSSALEEAVSTQTASSSAQGASGGQDDTSGGSAVIEGDWREVLHTDTDTT